MKSQLDELWEISTVLEILDPRSVVYLLLVIILFYIGKQAFNLLSPYNLDSELTEVDNKAVAVSFGGFLFGVGIILWGILGDDSVDVVTKKEFYWDLMDNFLWGCLGILLLLVSRYINDKLILYRFDNFKEIIQDKNVGTGVVQYGGLIGSALIIRACLIGGDNEFLVSFAMTGVFFIIGQIAFILFGIVYQKLTRYDLHDEIEKDNVAAGLAFGMNLVALSILISGYLEKHNSIPGLIVWLVMCMLILVTCRYLVDNLILPA